MGAGTWTWLEMQSWLSRSDVLTPLFSLGLSRFLNVILYAGGTFFLFLLLCLFVIYRACREEHEDGEGRPPERLVARHSRAY
jgi:hypothetical protein